MGWLTTLSSWAAGPIGGIVLTVLPYVAGAGAAGGLYLYGHHKGYVQAEALCNSAALKSVISAKDLEIKNLNAQINDDKNVIKDLKAKKQQVVVQTEIVTKTITKLVKDNPDCDLPDDVVKAFNNLRQNVVVKP